jgi:uncharacterized heparinase superfamily protein
MFNIEVGTYQDQVGYGISMFAHIHPTLRTSEDEEDDLIIEYDRKAAWHFHIIIEFLMWSVEIQIGHEDKRRSR